MLIVLDALADERFAKSPAITDHAKIRFYPGVPLVKTEGLLMGTLSVVTSSAPNHACAV
ncbi:GAF domain-containing protein [Argonema galeatum]|uniref:GAF domain-containing protein n=1 Tax=Argonema galeatum TaxID=2942762 RepID=UPI003B848890